MYVCMYLLYISSLLGFVDCVKSLEVHCPLDLESWHSNPFSKT